ncbi:MAG: hypothetical protein KUL83_00215 [Lentimicrobium sp.]|jgi:uncharacterized membrane protein|nr:hypothetical protein [Lentimicrobium sp.]MDD2528792.1 hypothetical protein [Lentimicrobiaceae bacterium]MDD4598382.1 hypothetical protein [Lentimicrobiaceae bacterium]MDY0025589.1 hypothetical protein [Lentimicrobium sp.]
MKRAALHRAVKLITFLMIGLMLMLVGNRALFTHTHQLQDGTFIEHAHPFDKAEDSAPLKSHHHTESGFLFFQHLGLLFLGLPLVLIATPFIRNNRIATYSVSRPALILLYADNGRAPPFV